MVDRLTSFGKSPGDIRIRHKNRKVNVRFAALGAAMPHPKVNKPPPATRHTQRTFVVHPQSFVLTGLQEHPLFTALGPNAGPDRSFW